MKHTKKMLIMQQRNYNYYIKNVMLKVDDPNLENISIFTLQKGGFLHG